MANPDELKSRKLVLITYLRMKLEEADWHAVADAAMDLRELEVKIEIAELLNKPT